MSFYVIFANLNHFRSFLLIFDHFIDHFYNIFRSSKSGPWLSVIYKMPMWSEHGDHVHRSNSFRITMGMKGWDTKNHTMLENSRKSFEGHTRADETKSMQGRPTKVAWHQRRSNSFTTMQNNSWILKPE
jgi:hypothetical protein